MRDHCATATPFRGCDNLVHRAAVISRGKTRDRSALRWLPTLCPVARRFAQQTEDLVLREFQRWGYQKLRHGQKTIPYCPVGFTENDA